MFPRDLRLRRSQDIIAVVRKGRRCAAGAVTCSFMGRPGKVGRATVIVDTKVSKKAVVRNLLKRRLRTLLRARPLPEGDLIVRLRPGAPALSFDQLSRDLDQCLNVLASTRRNG